MQTIVARRSVVSVSCKASPKNSANNKKFSQRAQDVVKDFGKKRTSVAKDNFNKLVSISQQDVQELSNLFKELDTLHRGHFEDLKASLEKNKNCKCKKEEEKVSEQIEVEVVEPSSVEEENIFVDK